MALSDSPLRQNKRSTPRRAVSAKNYTWSDSQKLEAVQTYLMLGSVKMTAAALKIPEITVKVWRTKAWWKELEGELKVQDELQLSTRLKKIAERSFEAVEDRLEHGNFIFDSRTGKLKRVPVSLKDAHKVAIDTVQQREMIGRKFVETANDGQIEQKLVALAERFAEIATQTINKNRTFDVDIEDVEVVESDTTNNTTDDEDANSSNYNEGDFDDAIHDEWEEGLQERK